MIEPYWQDEERGVTLYNGDCTQVMLALPAGSVSLVVTSPPYHVGMEYERRQTWEEFRALIDGFAKGCAHLLKPGGYAFVNFGTTTAHPLATETVYDEAFRKAELQLQARRVWVKPFAKVRCPFYTRIGPYPVAEYENLWTWWKEGGEKNHVGSRQKCRDWSLSARAVWESDGAEPIRSPHCAAFPESIPLKAMRAHADPGDLICDPFGGSGTTARAAVKFGSPCILIEREERYCELAARSLGDLERQLQTGERNLFSAASTQTVLPPAGGPSTPAGRGE